MQERGFFLVPVSPCSLFARLARGRCTARALRALSWVDAGRGAAGRAACPQLPGPHGAYAIADGVHSRTNNRRGLERVLKIR